MKEEIFLQTYMRFQSKRCPIGVFLRFNCVGARGGRGEDAGAVDERQAGAGAEPTAGAVQAQGAGSAAKGKTIFQRFYQFEVFIILFFKTFFKPTKILCMFVFCFFQQLEARIAAMHAENVRVAEEERRKTLGEETKHAKHVRGNGAKNK